MTVKTRVSSLTLLTLPLLLAACGNATLPGGGSVTVTADTQAVSLSATGQAVPDGATTNLTFTNQAGGKALSIDTATLHYGDTGTLNVSLAAFTVPAGVACSDGSTSGCDTANLQFTAKTFARALANADFFGGLPALNPGKSSFPVQVTFPGVSNTLTFTVKVGASAGTGTGTGGTVVAAQPAPVLTVNTPGSGPYSGVLNVTVAGNFDPTSTVDRVILQTTDVNGSVDTTTYTSNQPSATFSVDTSRFPDGNVTLQAVAITAADTAGTVLRGRSADRVVAVQNITAPTIAVAQPLSGSTFSGATLPVQVNVTRKNSAFTVTGNQMVVDLLDYRGQRVASQTITGVADNVNGGYSTTFDVGALPVDTYSIRVRTGVSVAGAAAQTIETVSTVTLKSVSLNPPAAVIRFPVALRSATDPATPLPAVLNADSGIVVQVSDDTGVVNVQVRLVRPDGTVLNAYLLNLGFDKPGQKGPLDIPINTLDIDGSQYVPNGVYTLRVTVADNDGNRNVQEIPVKVDRQSTIAGLTQTATPNGASTKSGSFNYTSGTWTINGLPITPNPNLSGTNRILALIYKDGVLAETRYGLATSDPSAQVTKTFTEIGVYRVDWMVQDLTTGATKLVHGSDINVTLNP